MTFLASINYTGRTSMEVGVRVETENIRTHEVRHTNSCYFTMVAVDDNMVPIPVPQKELLTREDEGRFEEAKARRELRAEMERRRQEIKDHVRYRPRG